MKSANIIMSIARIIAILIVIAYAIGLFQTYDTLKASILLIVAVIIGLDILFWAKQTIRNRE